MTNAHFDLQRLKSEVDMLISDYGFDPYDDDNADIWLSALEGETSLDTVLDRLLELRYRAAANEEAVKERIKNLKDRADRYKREQEVLTKAMQKTLNMVNQKTYKTVEATYSIRAGTRRVEIEDETAIPTQLTTVKTITNPDKAAIKAALEAGEIVPGATLVTGEETISIRTK